ncbi:MAG: cupin domain-containing protein [Granulosicoccus sp.]
MSAYPIVDADPGVKRQVLSESPDLMVVSFQFERGAQGKLHNHPHVQSTYVRSGRFTFSLGEAKKEVGPGDSFIIESDLVHGCECIEAGELIDTFTPRRDDFL